MDSFSAVYLQAIYRLSIGHEDAACVLAKTILENTRKVWRRGWHYRRFKDTDADYKRRTESIDKYVIDILVDIKKIFENKSEEIVNMCDNIWNDVRSE